MPDFAPIFGALKPVFAGCTRQLAIKEDTATHYVLESKLPSPFKQHKGHPLAFGSVQTGKAYVSLHLVPLYMNEKLKEGISPELKKRMQGKACFNFAQPPDPALVKELKALARVSLADWKARKWL